VKELIFQNSQDLTNYLIANHIDILTAAYCIHNDVMSPDQVDSHRAAIFTEKITDDLVKSNPEFLDYEAHGPELIEEIIEYF
jgi:hypothetical protein